MLSERAGHSAPSTIACQHQVGRPEFVVERENAGALNVVLKLTDIAGPAVCLERIAGIVEETQPGAALGLCEFRQEESGARHDVSWPVAERRQLDRAARNPVVEVFTELARGDERFEVAVCGHEYSHVHLVRCILSAREYLALFKNTQQLGLEHVTDLADCSEEACPADGEFKHFLACAVGAGERVLSVAEEFGLQDTLSVGFAVHRREGRGHSLAQVSSRPTTTSLPVPLVLLTRTAAFDRAARRASSSPANMGWLSAAKLSSPH